MLKARDLGDGLRLRPATRRDAGQLAEFNGAMHADDGLPAEELAEWTLDLMEGGHPWFRADEDATVVEDTDTGRIVSALFLLPQLWSYAGIELPVGQPELIATHPDYRRRGLIRAQFDAIHSHSDPDHVWQYISGIPWYYRQFGYSYAIDLVPAQVWWLRDVKPGAPDGYRLRAATGADVPFLASVERAADVTRGALTSVRGERGWALELRRRPGSLPACEVWILELAAEPTGYVVMHRSRHFERMRVVAFELVSGRSWLDPTAAVLAALHGMARDDPSRPKAIVLGLAPEHPAVRSAATKLTRSPASPYAFYVRVPDLVRLLDRVRPALDARVAASPAAGHSGRLVVDLYTSALALTLAGGQVVSIERCPSAPDDADVSLPIESMLSLVFGSRSVAAVEGDVADCQIRSDAGALLLDVLFPRMPLGPWESG